LSWRNAVRPWIPPGAVRTLSQVRCIVTPAPWEVAPDDWSSTTRGWNVESVAREQEEKWPAFVNALQGNGTIGVNHEVPRGSRFDDVWGHNAAMAFGYVLALAAHRKTSLRMLDWGGGIGHYYALSRALLPEVKIDYWSQDVPLLARLGRRLLPEAHFLEQPDEFLQHNYDLVIAISSIWYQRDWKTLVDNLLSVCGDYFYLSRMVVVDHAETFAALQRPSGAGYRTEYLCWILNRQELVSHIEGRGAKLLREFLIGDAPYIHRAPVQGSLSGFLFRKG
jgi:putative methyltransferase (TIGR04325 family)